MSTILPTSHVLAITVYVLGTASPGPSNLAIMSTAMCRGRAQALALAAGVITGSLLWGLSSAFGFSALARDSSPSLAAVKVLGGTYLLWGAWKAGCAASAPMHGQATSCETGAEGLAAMYRTGVATHLTNPKAMVVWASVIALALPHGGTTEDALSVVAGCALLGALVFASYALAFSTARVRQIYRVAYRWFNAALALAFGLAGLHLILSRNGLV